MYKTRAEIFTLAWNGLKSQGFRKAMQESSPDDPTCLYITEDGRRCAIGWCMSADDISPKSQPTGSVNSKEVQELANIADEDLKWARMLQHVHDKSNTPEELKQRMIGFAFGNEFYHIVSGEI